MTDDERRNRNPAPEVFGTTRAELNAMPEVRVDELELYRVYILESPLHVVTMNYMGKVPAWNPFTGEPMLCHQFVGPRVDLTVNLMARDGRLWTGKTGEQKITVRKWTGADA